MCEGTLLAVSPVEQLHGDLTLKLSASVPTREDDEDGPQLNQTQAGQTAGLAVVHSRQL